MLQRRLLVLIASAAAAIACWRSVPGTALDRAAFTAVVRGFTNPPLFVSGNGSHTTPWKLRTFASHRKTNSRPVPVIVVSLGDDPEGFFQSSPPSPIDLAVIFSNFQRLGAKNAATAAVLAWDSPDPIGLMALDNAISRFDSLIMAAPLSRGAVPEPMPSAFRKASIPVAAIQGDTSSLPVVNRVPLPGIILGAENTLAGFQTLDSESGSGFIPLIAKWDDRAVFAFPLLVALQRLDLSLDDVEIRIGEYLKLGADGPIVPIDRYGHLDMQLKALPPFAEIPAESLIDGPEDLFPKQMPEPIILRDDRSASEPASRRFSENLPALLNILSSDTELVPARAYRRLRGESEIGLLLILVIILTAASGLPAFPRNVVFLTTAATCLAAQCIAAGIAELWLPAIPSLAAILAAFPCSFGMGVSRAKPEPDPISPLSEPSLPVPKTACAEPPLDPASTIPESSKPPKRRKKPRN